MPKKVIVIGAGPGGYPAALRLKELGADVTVVEAWDFGGTCLNRGCIPSKAFLDTGHRVTPSTAAEAPRDGPANFSRTCWTGRRSSRRAE